MTATEANPPSHLDFDAVVVGTGFAGIQMAYELDRLGMSMRVIEAGTDVGGVWNWNRYPGARTDISSYQYCYSFSKDLWEAFEWKERYPAQAEVLEYLRCAVDLFGLRRYMQFETRVTAASFDEESNRWTISTDAGERLSAKYFILASGGLSRPLDPPFPGLEDFEGDYFQTARWPSVGVDFSGKRVGVIGTGSTGVQVIPTIAPDAAQVVVFQRTPNYVVEAGNKLLTDDERADFKSRWAELRDTLRTHPGGLTIPMPTSSYFDQSPEEARAMFEESWQKGGLHLVLTFWDLTSHPEANEALCEFIRSKIRGIVNDPETAELLCPKGYPFGAKRPPIGHHYYEAFNRDNVLLVDVSANPIERVTAKGLLTQAGDYELDVLIFATGFDAITGAALAIDIRGRDGLTLREQWANGPRTLASCAVDGFPNMFLLAGPQSPFANQPVVIEIGVELVTRAIAYATERGLASIEASTEAVDAFVAEADQLRRANMAVQNAADVNSFIVGANVEGKAHGTYFFFGPVSAFRERTEGLANDGFKAFHVVEG